MILISGNTDNTYDVKRAKQVLIHEKKDKRVFTAVLSVDLRDEILSIQSIWNKVLTTSLPNNKISKKPIKKNHRFKLNRWINWNNLKTNQA